MANHKPRVVPVPVGENTNGFGFDHNGNPYRFRTVMTPAKPSQLRWADEAFDLPAGLTLLVKLAPSSGPG